MPGPVKRYTELVEASVEPAMKAALQERSRADDTSDAHIIRQALKAFLGLDRKAAE